MATQAHCAYCFETLAASFEQRPPLSLQQVQELWELYYADNRKGAAGSAEGILGDTEGNEDAGVADVEGKESVSARPAAISRLLSREGAVSSSSSLPSTKSEKSSSMSGNDSPGSATPMSSMSSSSSLSSSSKKTRQHDEEYPLFVTWNTVSRNGQKSLRGCIGTFEPQGLAHGLQSYALTSAFDDFRFQPIPASLLPSLSAHVTLLHSFSAPTRDPMDWTIGKHGIRIAFSFHGRRHGSTYLPDVAQEQGWTKEEALISLMRKAGWSGSSSSWSKTWGDGNGELVRYEGKAVGLQYDEWKQWRDWVDRQGVHSRALD